MNFVLAKKKWILSSVLLLMALFLFLIISHTNPYADPAGEVVKKSIACAIIVAGGLIYALLYNKLMTLPVELFQNRRLIWKLAKNDFKTRYAGSWMGIVWAFVQPVVTVVMYYFVFEVVFTSRAQAASTGLEIPYALWLTVGLVPWFFFSEALNNGTGALLSYNYLVKKVVFKVSILPIIKLVAATFVHFFFVAFMLVMYHIFGYGPNPYAVQLIYYSICMFVFTLAICYTTCAVVIFFRDLTQIINILLQVGMWATPILWNLDIVTNPTLRMVLKMNPVFYIVNGYRDALFERTWFWEDFFSTAFFWIVTCVLFGIGTLIFKRLKPHFADVL